MELQVFFKRHRSRKDCTSNRQGSRRYRVAYKASGHTQVYITMPSTVCTGVTKRGRACRNITMSPCGKCHCHREGVVRGPFNLDKPRCGAPTKKGTACKCIPTKGGNYCSAHSLTADRFQMIQDPEYDVWLPTDDIRGDDQYILDNVPVFSQTPEWFLCQELKRSVELRYKQMETEYKRVLMASRIKRYFMRSMASPEYRLCRDRLTREFSESPSI